MHNIGYQLVLWIEPEVDNGSDLTPIIGNTGVVSSIDNSLKSHQRLTFGLLILKSQSKLDEHKYIG